MRFSANGLNPVHKNEIKQRGGIGRTSNTPERWVGSGGRRKARMEWEERERVREQERAYRDRNRKVRSHGFNPARGRIGACARTGNPAPTDSTPHEESLTAQLSAERRADRRRTAGEACQASDSGRGHHGSPIAIKKDISHGCNTRQKCAARPRPPPSEEACHMGKPKNSPHHDENPMGEPLTALPGSTHRFYVKTCSHCFHVIFCHSSHVFHV